MSESRIKYQSSPIICPYCEANNGDSLPMYFDGHMDWMTCYSCSMKFIVHVDETRIYEHITFMPMRREDNAT